jgi:hypothetical protein
MGLRVVTELPPSEDRAAIEARVDDETEGVTPPPAKKATTASKRKATTKRSSTTKSS